MSLYKRNILVGLTVLTSLILLGWMILRFSDIPIRWITPQQIPIRLQTASAEGLGEGSSVMYMGMTVGRVMRLHQSPDQTSVIIDAVVDHEPPLPANVRGVIRTQLLGGGSNINLELATPELLQPGAATTPATRPANVVPIGQIQPGQLIPAIFLGIDFLPPAISQLASDLTLTSAELRRTAQQVRDAKLVENLAATIDKTGKTIDSINSLVSDKKIRQDIQDALANFREASQSAKQIGQDLQKLSATADKRLDELTTQGNKVLATAEKRIDEVATQLLNSLAKVDKSLDEFQTASRKLNDGNGSASKLLHDPALYENLLDTSRELKTTIQTFQRLAEQWEQEGVYLKMNKKK
jgi:phospholipid/cholesterol/gamma-HCH transport system substrate-binding protein